MNLKIMNDIETKDYLLRKKLSHLLIEAQSNQVLLVSINPAKFPIKKALEVY